MPAFFFVLVTLCKNVVTFFMEQKPTKKTKLRRKTKTNQPAKKKKHKKQY